MFRIYNLNMDTKIKMNIPSHVGIIMDGNRRWARERNLPTLEGHFNGYRKMHQIPGYFYAEGVKIVSVYAFSTENWNRSRDEVNYLMKLLKKALQDDLEDFQKKEYRLFVSGRINDLPGDLPEICVHAMSETANNKNGIKPEHVHRVMIRKYLYNSEISDPDIIVRTSGEKRLSGFQLWRSAYSELLFMEKYWPDFEKDDVQFILKEYNNRNRRFGGDE